MLLVPAAGAVKEAAATAGEVEETVAGLLGTHEGQQGDAGSAGEGVVAVEQGILKDVDA